MRGLSEHGRKPRMRGNVEKPMGSAPEERGLHPEQTSSLAESSGTYQILKMGSPLPTARIPRPKGC